MVEEPLVTSMWVQGLEYFWDDSCWKFKFGCENRRSKLFTQLEELHSVLNRKALEHFDEEVLVKILLESKFSENPEIRLLALKEISRSWVEKALTRKLFDKHTQEEEWVTALKKCLLENNLSQLAIVSVIKTMTPYFPNSSQTLVEPPPLPITPQVSQLDLF